MRLYLLVTVAAASVALVACSKIAKNEAAAAGHNLGVATVAATNSGAGVIPSGRYACDGGIYVDIRGSEYRGPTGEPSGEFRPYVMGTGNSVNWTAGFGEFNVVSTRYMGISHDSAAQPWFAVTYNRTHGGGVEEIDCEREGA